MLKYFSCLLLIILFIGFSAQAQLSITSGGTDYTIDFDTDLSGVNNGTYQGDGFVPDNPATGQLNSNAWATTGMSEGDSNFGGTYESGEFAQGATEGEVQDAGFYSFEVENSNFAFGFQQEEENNNFVPGTIVLKIQNNTGAGQ